MQSFPLVFEANVLKNMSSGFDASVHNLRLNWPSFSMDEFGAGIAVQAAGGAGSHEVIFTKPWRFERYAANHKRSSQLSVAFREDSRTVECMLLRYLPNGLWMYAFSILIFSALLSPMEQTLTASLQLRHVSKALS